MARNTPIASERKPAYGGAEKSYFKRLAGQWDIQLMVVPALLLIIVFQYIPMYGVLLGFQDYSLFKGFLDSPWVGLKHFEAFFNDPAGTDMSKIFATKLELDCQPKG